MPVETNEEILSNRSSSRVDGLGNGGWLSEIKHLKALLGGMAEEHNKS
jgi:hypothetical protein